MNTLALKQTLKQEQQSLADAYRSTQNGSNYLQGRSALVDSVLCDLWKSSNLPENMALLAVGGYGRGELYPYSDIDLLILLDALPDSMLEKKLEEMVGQFWDIGLEVGLSVRTVDECITQASTDVTIQTALLETRCLIGDAELRKHLDTRLRQALDPAAFFRAKRLEQQERHQRYADTAFSLEPNCKESPGGLRDLQTILWMANAAGIGRNLRSLQTSGLLTHHEVRQLRGCEEALQRLRISLHLQAGRREDRLLFDHQEKLAETFQFAAGGTRRRSEMMMRRYYLISQTVTQYNNLLLQNIENFLTPGEISPPEKLNERFHKHGSQLSINDEGLFRKHPEAILESFYLMQQHAELKGMTPKTLRALWRSRGLVNHEFRHNPANRALFLKILQSPRGIVHELRRMNQMFVLGRYLPAFGEIVGQMQHDLFHVYTVDQHILQVVRNLRRFGMEEFAHEHPLCSELFLSFESNWLLYVAALFHDIAKGRGGDHAELGTVDAQEFCTSHGMSPADSAMVVWIVRHHLLMSLTAQKQDISDPEVIRAFAERVGSPRHLTALYLFTVADIRGTSPKVWNTWKSQLLENLYHQTLRVLEAQEMPGPQSVIAARKDDVFGRLRFFALPGSVTDRLWKQLDTVYFLRHSADEIAWHTKALHYQYQSNRPIVKSRFTASTGEIQVMVYTPDQKELFALILGFLARCGYTVVEAKIHTTRHGYALDSFKLLDVEGRGNEREMLTYIEHELVEKISRGESPEAPAPARYSRQVRHFPLPPVVTIEADAKGSRYMLSIEAVDRPGLLFGVASILSRHSINLYTAKIATLGERVDDTFLIGGGQLEQSSARIRLETELLDMLKI